jgi:hypothetical protein
MKKLYTRLPIIFFTVFFLNLLSCTKLDIRDQVNMAKKNMMTILSTTDSTNINSFFWLCGDQLLGAKDSSFRISALATFTDSVTHLPVGINGIILNSRNLNQQSDHSLSFMYSDTAAYLQEGLDIFGTTVKVKITGSSPADTVTRLIYMPKKVVRNVADFPLGKLDIANNLTLNWTPDPSCTWGNVAIEIFYNAAKSRFLNDPTLPASDTTFSYIVPDNGTYTIPSSDLRRLKVRSIVSISLGRGSILQAVLPISARRVFYYATSSVSTYPLDVESSAYPIIGSSGMNVVYTLKMTNLATSILYTFHLNANSTNITLGQVPPGNYNIVINHGLPANNLVTYIFNNLTATGNSASFTNVPVSSTSIVSVMPSNL